MEKIAASVFFKMKKYKYCYHCLLHFEKQKRKQKQRNPNVCCVMVLYLFCVVLGVGLPGHFVMVPLNLTYLHCLQHSFFECLFNLYY